MKFAKILSPFLAFVIFFVTSVSGVYAESSEETYITTESFIVDTYSDEPDSSLNYNKNGYKKVEAVTEITNSQKFIITKVKAVEDFYNLDGVYLYSKVSDNEFKNDYTTGLAEQRSGEIKSTEGSLTSIPALTIQTKTKNESNTKNEVITLNGNEKKLVSKNVEEKTGLIENTEASNIQGFTKQNLYELKKLIDQANQEAQLASNTSRAGAYDNYYNYDYTSGNFVAQALSEQGQKYVKITGTTIGDSKNASGFNKFSGYIDEYEKNVVNYMQSNTFMEVLGWASALSSLVLLVAGWAAGPAGWISIVLNYGGALALFAGLTSTAYSTYARLQYSKNAASSLQNARNSLNYLNWGNMSMSLVSGV